MTLRHSRRPSLLATLSGVLVLTCVASAGFAVGQESGGEEAAGGAEAATPDAPDPQDGTGEPAEPASETGAADQEPRDSAAELYVTRCTGCHTIGRGALSGPDLLPSIAWPPDQLRPAVARMESKVGALSAEDVEVLVEFLKEPDVRARIEREQERIAERWSASLEPASAEHGRRLFDGREPLQNGGMPCIACHRAVGAGGGTLGTDLTGVFGRMGEAGLRSACTNAAFPLMDAAYSERPVTEQEAVHLTAFFEALEGQDADSGEAPVGMAALVLAAAAVVGLRLALRGHHRGSRAQLVGRRI